MKRLANAALSLLLACSAAPSWGASSEPYLAYLYPAGGRAGATLLVTAAGQALKAAAEAYVSGTGIQARIVSYTGPGGPLDKVQQEELRRLLIELKQKNQARQKDPAAVYVPGTPTAALPDLPELRGLAAMDNRQLQMVNEAFLDNDRKPKPPMNETVLLEVRIDADAAPGNREIRLRTPAALTNPIAFRIGSLPEEREPDLAERITGADRSQLSGPVVLNGRIMPGEADSFAFQWKKGAVYSIRAEARSLIPYLADAVPGWFQATLAVLDGAGREAAFADDTETGPDPLLSFRVPEDGAYAVAVRDALFRGRYDFVYRIRVEEQPSDTPQAVRPAFPDPVPFQADGEAEPDGSAAPPQQVPSGCLVSGRIGRPGDVDVFRFPGGAGEEIVAEVYARRAGSPLDSLLRILDPGGAVLAVSDDFEDKAAGLVTHQADSYLRLRLPASGAYGVQVSDAQRHGGDAYAYSLRIGPPQPSFTLLTAKSAVSLLPGGTGVLAVQAVRRDGWDGDIEIVLRDAPRGFSLGGAVIPKGRSGVRITVTSPKMDSPASVPVRLEGRALIGGRTVSRPVIPADSMMQAFGNTHLVPAAELVLACGKGSPLAAAPDLPPGGRLVIPSGGSAALHVTKLPRMDATFGVELVEPPAGVTLAGTAVEAGSATLLFAADGGHDGLADNLIVRVYREADGKGKATVALLPAIPFRIGTK